MCTVNWNDCLRSPAGGRGEQGCLHSVDFEMKYNEDDTNSLDQICTNMYVGGGGLLGQCQSYTITTAKVRVPRYNILNMVSIM